MLVYFMSTMFMYCIGNVVHFEYLALCVSILFLIKTLNKIINMIWHV